VTQKLFVQNILPSVSEDQIRSIFATVGEVLDVQRPFHRETLQPRKFMFVSMDSDEAGAKAIEQLDGYEVAGQQLIVTAADLNKRGHEINYREVMRIGTEIAEVLGETDPRPRSQIAHIIELKGEEFARQLLTDTLKIQEEGGMDVTDGSRKRTTGGVFFKLSKDRLDAKTRGIIFPRPGSNDKKGKKAADGKDDKKQQKRTKPGAAKGDRKNGQKTEGRKPRLSSDAIAAADASAVAKPALAPTRVQEVTPEVQQHYDELKAAEATAQQHLSDIQSKKIKGSPIAALKELADLKAQIAQLVKTYPDLKKKS
jgi:RNA recognition motif-containing protein